MISLSDIKKIFVPKAFPTADQFWNTFTSFWHKSERLPMQQVLGLNDALNEKASKEDVANATTNDKGIFTTEILLKAAYPPATNKKGFYAFVGSQNPFRKWEVQADGGQWIDTGQDINIADVDLADYAKQEDIKNQQKQINALTLRDLVLGGNNNTIGQDGGQVAKNTNSGVYYIVVKGGLQYNIMTNVSKAGNQGGRAYAFYTQLPIASENFISGSEYKIETQYVSEMATAPENATILAISADRDKVYQIAEASINVITENERLQNEIDNQKIKTELINYSLDFSTKKDNLIAPLYQNFDKYTLLSTGNVATASLIDFKNDKYKFKKIVKIGFDGLNPLTGTMRPQITADFKFCKDITIGCLFFVKNTGSTANFGCSVVSHRGYPDSIVETIPINLMGNQVTTVINTINSGNAYSYDVLNGKGTVKITDYTPYADGYLFEACANVSGLLPADAMYMILGFNRYITANSQVGFEYQAGLQIYEGIVDLNLKAANDLYFDSYNLDAEKHIGEKSLSYSDSYQYHNLISNFFKGGQKILNADKNNSPQHAGSFTLMSGLTVNPVNDFSVGYKLSFADGSVIPKYVNHNDRNTILSFTPKTYATDEEKANATFQFWIDRRELNGNGLVYHSDGGGDWWLYPEDLMAEGLIETRQQISAPTDPVVTFLEVVKVSGDYSCIRMYTNAVRLAIYNGSENDVKQLTIYNPVCLYCKHIDPFYYYQSEAEKNKSKLIGKKFLLIGDSQYNDRQALIEIAEKTGMTGIAANNGGHSLQYRSFSNWLYKTDLRDLVMVNTDIDYYIFTVSTNDGGGGGNLDLTTIQSVLDNYPVWGDDAATVANKQALFAAMSEATRQQTFGYMQTYAAYIKQILNNYPNARIICCSVPISCSGYLTGQADDNGNGIWAADKSPDIARNDLNPNRQKIRNESREVAEYFGAIWVDLLNEVGLTYENYTTYCVDGTHWGFEIKKRIGYSITKGIEKSF